MMERMITIREIFLGLAWLFICVLQLTSAVATPANYTVMLSNTSASLGKSASLVCAVNQGSTSGSLTFIIQRPDMNYTLICPGNPVKYPAMSLSGTCDVSTPLVISGTWVVSNIATDFNNTAFKCGYPSLNTTIGYLIISGTSKYLSMLFGCVMGGFFGILIVFGVTYVALKRSERCQECFKGKPEDEDPTVTATKEY